MCRQAGCRGDRTGSGLGQTGGSQIAGHRQDARGGNRDQVSAGQRAVQGQSIDLNENIKLIYSGAGPENAERAASLLISQGANCLISWGCAAALSPQLNPGDLLIPEQVLSAENLTFSLDKQWLQHLGQILPVSLTINSGALTESRMIVAKSSEKQLLHERTGAVALDMESAGLVRVAEKAGVAALVIRVVADPADMDLPQAVAQSLNSNGQVEINKLLLFLLWHPWEVPALIRLGLHFQAARKTLKAVAEHLDRIASLKSQAGS